VVLVTVLQIPNDVFVVMATVHDVGSLSLQYGKEMHRLLAGCPLVVISCGLELAVEHCPGRGFIKLRWFHPVYAGSCVPAASACLLAF
jgi:hypothetical protein